jgi:hypothetical protein
MEFLNGSGRGVLAAFALGAMRRLHAVYMPGGKAVFHHVQQAAKGHVLHMQAKARFTQREQFLYRWTPVTSHQRCLCWMQKGPHVHTPQETQTVRLGQHVNRYLRF